MAATGGGWLVAQSATYRPISTPPATTAEPTPSSFLANTLTSAGPVSRLRRSLCWLAPKLDAVYTTGTPEQTSLYTPARLGRPRLQTPGNGLVTAARIIDVPEAAETRGGRLDRRQGRGTAA